MLGSDNVGVHDTGGRLKGIDSGVETQLSNGTGQDSGSVQLEMCLNLFFNCIYNFNVHHNYIKKVFFK